MQIPKKKVMLSHSRMQDYLSCPARYRFNNLFPNGRNGRTDSFALGAGTAFHLGVQKFIETGDDIAADFEMFMAFPFHIYDMIDAPKSYGRDFEALLSAMKGLRESGINHAYELAVINGKKGIEHLTEFYLGDIGNLSFYYQVPVDLIMRRKHDNALIAIDIKTTRDKEIPFRYNFSSQLVGYMLTVETLFGRGLDKATVLEGEYWHVRLDVTNPTLNIVEVKKDYSEVQKWLAKLTMVCQMIAAQENSDNWLQNENSCVQYNQNCRFLQICHTDAKEAELMDWFITANNGETGNARNDEEPTTRVDMLLF